MHSLPGGQAWEMVAGESQWVSLHDPFMPRSTSPEEGTPKPECPYTQSLLIYIVDCVGWAQPLPGKHKPPSRIQRHRIIQITCPCPSRPLSPVGEGPTRK